MVIEKVTISDDFKLIGGHDTPPKKKNNKKDETGHIPISENDVENLTYIEETDNG